MHNKIKFQGTIHPSLYCKPGKKKCQQKKNGHYIISILTLVEIRVKRSGNPKHINSIAIGKHKILILQILF